MLSVGRTAEARPHIDHFLTVAQQRAADNPQSARAKGDLALAHEIQGMWRAEMGDLDGAMKSYRTYQTTIVALSEADDSNTYYRALVAGSHERIAEVLEREGKTGTAILAYQQALEIVTELSASDPGEARLQISKARLLSALGGLLLETGEPLGARERLAEAREILEPLMKRQPEHAATRHELTLALYRLSRVMAEGSDADTAEALAGEAWVLIESAPPGPRTTEIRQLLEESPD
jgi:tetratricopeptide (TPR) repeat protein